jgi:alpha-ketoglutarate-dependent taurine dioxygenase
MLPPEDPSVVAVPAAATRILCSRPVAPDTAPDRWPRRDQRIADDPAVAAVRAALLEHLHRGPGFAVLRVEGDVPGGEHGLLEVFWNLFTSFADPLPHSAAGDLVYEVTHSIVSEPASRYYSRSNIGGDIHTDGTYIHSPPPTYVALGCLAPARDGGASIVVDGRRLVRELRALFPSAFRELTQPFHFDCDGQAGDAMTIIRPVVRCDRDAIELCYLRQYIVAGHDKAGIPLTNAAQASLDVLDELLGRPDLRWTCTLARCEMLVLDNRVVLHGRTAFEDGGGHKRRLVRLWGR